jgi:surfeit locus 1 family protein
MQAWLPSEVADHAALASLAVHLLKGRWLAGHILAVVVIVTFVSLGIWQLARDSQKQDTVRAREAAFAAPAPDFVAKSATLAAGDRVEARGTYDPELQALLRNRVRDGKTGFDVLTPLRLDDDTGVLVDRGWISASEAESVPLPPDGEIVVRGLLRQSRPLATEDAVRDVGGLTSLPRVGAEVLQPKVGYDLRDTWIEAQYQRPTPGDDDPALPKPAPPDQVNHFQYAIEWFALAAVPLIGWPIVCWRASRRRETS